MTIAASKIESPELVVPTDGSNCPANGMRLTFREMATPKLYKDG